MYCVQPLAFRASIPLKRQHRSTITDEAREFFRSGQNNRYGVAPRVTGVASLLWPFAAMMVREGTMFRRYVRGRKSRSLSFTVSASASGLFYQRHAAKKIGALKDGPVEGNFCGYGQRRQFRGHVP